MNLIIEATIENISTRADNTIKVVIGTQEMDAEQSAKLFQFRNQVSKVLFSTDNISKPVKDTVIETAIDTDEPKDKTPSQRLRSVLFRYQEQEFPAIDFEQFYKSEIEKIITHYKNKLNPK
jgi:hypothetical protein